MEKNKKTGATSLTWKSAWGGTYELFLEVAKYSMNDNLAILLLDIDEDGYPEPYADLTKNLDVKLPENRAFIDTNNLPGIEEWIVKNKLGKPTGRARTSGFCIYPEFEFDLEELEKYRLENL